jgi:hypothetical protein
LDWKGIYYWLVGIWLIGVRSDRNVDFIAVLGWFRASRRCLPASADYGV